MAHFKDSTSHIDTLLFTLIITRILTNVGFTLDPAHAIPRPRVFIDVRLWSKHDSHIYDPILPLVVTLSRVAP